MLWMVSNQFYTNAFREHKGDIRYLYKLMVKLTGGTSDNTIPECKSDEKLTENFSHFFLEKSKNIRADLDQFEEYEPSMVETVFELSNFASVSESDIRKVMSKLEAKSCELDIIPTHIVKNYLDIFIPALTHRVNLSLKNGNFDKSWKSAIL